MLLVGDAFLERAIQRVIFEKHPVLIYTPRERKIKGANAHTRVKEDSLRLECAEYGVAYALIHV